MLLRKARANKYIVVEGVKFAVRWSDVGRGTSFFIPCINAEQVRKQVMQVFNNEGWKFKHKVRAENGYFGIRIWRTL